MRFIEKRDCKLYVSNGSANVLSTYQWCIQDRNLRDRDRDLAQNSRRDRDRDFVIKAETETWKFETETRDLTFL